MIEEETTVTKPKLEVRKVSTPETTRLRTNFGLGGGVATLIHKGAEVAVFCGTEQEKDGQVWRITRFGDFCGWSILG